MDTDISQLSKSPDAALRILGALTALTLQTKADAANLANTLTTTSSMPFRFPSLSNNGTVIIILKLAIGATEIWLLLLGVKYGSSGEIIRLLAKTTEGGKAKVE